LIFRLLIYFEDYIKMILMMTSVIGYKYKKSKTALILTVIFSFSFAACSVIFKDNSQVTDLLYIVLSMTVPVIVFFSVEGRKKAAFSFASFLSVFFLDDLFSKALLFYTGKEYSVFSENQLENFIVMSADLVLYYGLFRLIEIFVIKRKRKTDIKKTGSVYVIIVLSAIILLYIYAAIMEKNGYDSVTIVFAVVCVLFLCIAVVLVYNNASRTYYKEKSQINEELMRAQKQYYESLLEKEKETRKFRHDISNHLLCIKTMINSGKYQEAEEYISEIEKRTDNLRRKCSTGNELINVIINDISGRFEAVNLEWSGMIPGTMDISDMDICTVFYNVFENAFCAAAECSEDAVVSAEVRTVSNSLMITVNNNMIRPVKRKGEYFVSSKKDKASHGYGTQNIKDCIESNGGKVEFRYTENEFTVVIVLPNVIV